MYIYEKIYSDSKNDYQEMRELRMILFTLYFLRFYKKSKSQAHGFCCCIKNIQVLPRGRKMPPHPEACPCRANKGTTWIVPSSSDLARIRSTPGTGENGSAGALLGPTGGLAKVMGCHQPHQDMEEKHNHNQDPQAPGCRRPHEDLLPQLLPATVFSERDCG